MDHMHHMERLLELAIEEAEEAEEYIEKALHDKASKKHIADKFCTLAEEELKHAEELKALASRELDEHKREHGNVSEHGRALYEIRSEDIADMINEVKREIMLYRS